jgi:hypothetical protein
MFGSTLSLVSSVNIVSLARISVQSRQRHSMSLSFKGSCLRSDIELRCRFSFREMIGRRACDIWQRLLSFRWSLTLPRHRRKSPVYSLDSSASPKSGDSYWEMVEMSAVMHVPGRSLSVIPCRGWTLTLRSSLNFFKYNWTTSRCQYEKIYFSIHICFK